MAYKVFTAGDILTAAQVNTYLMNQSVPVFATAAARDAAITSPSEGQYAYLTDSDMTHYDGSQWTANPLSQERTPASYTLVLADAGRLLYFSNASQVQVTIPTNASVAFPLGTRIVLMSTGLGGLTLLTPSLTLIAAAAPFVTVIEGEAIYVEKVATNTWAIIGGTE